MNPSTDVLDHLLLASVNRACFDRQALRSALTRDPALEAVVAACWPRAMGVAPEARPDPLPAIDAFLATASGAAQDLALLLSADRAIQQRRHALAAARLALLDGRATRPQTAPWQIAENHVRAKLAMRRGEVTAMARWHAAAVAAAEAHPEVGDPLRELDLRMRLMTHRWDGCDAILAELDRGAATATGIGHRALLWRAWLAIEQGRAADALALIADHRRAPWAYLLRLVAAAQLQRWPTVEDLLAHPPGDDASDPMILGYRGMVRYLAGRLDDVAGVLAQLSLNDRESTLFLTTLHLALNTALANGRGAQARRLLSRIDPHADLPSYHLEWARLHRLEGDEDAAAARFAQLVASQRPAYIAWRLQWAHELASHALVAWWWPHCQSGGVARRLPALPPPQMAPATPAGDAEPVLVGDDPAIRDARERIALFAPRSEPVLISGETGTGKEIVARLLHRAACPDAPMVSVNCAAIPASLAEAELFGHVRGAFTGAERARGGAIAAAGDGVLFLDEIASLPLALQGVLLRVLETGDYRPVGGDRNRRLRARVIAACDADLSAVVAEGRLRADLLYRLQRLTIDLPPLRHRPGDIAALAQHFLTRFGFAGPSELDRSLLRHWRRHPWTGNVRELRNEVERMAILHGDERRFTVAHSTIATGAAGLARPTCRQPPVVGATAARRERIVRLAHKQGHVTRKAVITATGCAPATAQRDLSALVAAARLRRVRPGIGVRFDYFVPTDTGAAASATD
ncbi:MAG: sigma 54-interacting transcriptional regulator [Planctomycetota bacterium]